MIEIINFRASTIEPNPKEVTYWVDLNEDPLGGIIKSWDGEGHWRTLRVLEGTIVKVEERIHDWVTQKLAEQTEWVDQTVKEMTDLVHTWDGRIALLEGEVVRLEDVKQDKLIPGFGIDINENNVISSTVDLTLYRVVPELPTENIDDTKIYIIFDPDGTGANTHKEYVYINGKWELLGEYADYASRSDFLKEVQDRKDADDELAQDIDTVDNKVEQLKNWKSKLTPYKVLDSIGTKYYEQNGVDKLQITYRTFPVDGNGTITSTSFDLQEATSTRNGLMANTDKIKLDETIPNLITEEQNARIAADSTITTNLNKEIQDREEAISNVSNNFNQLIENVSNQVNAKIDAEVTRSTNKDNDHDAAIANEITRAKAAEKANADAISQEISRATNAETNLSNDLQAEITRSINKDNSLQTSITNEITRATNAESELDNRTSTLESDNSTNKQNIATLQSNLGPIKTAWDKRGTKDGLLTLGDNNLIQSQYLPSYVDDVIDVYATYDVSPTNQISNIKLYSDASHTTTITGESGKSYIDVTNSHPGYQFRWSGTSWVQITSGGLIVGNITGTAYDGSEGNKNRTAINSLPTNLVSQFPNVVTYDTDVRLESGGLVSKNGINYGDQVIMTSRVFPAATSTKAGVMTAQDKVFLDSVKSSVGNFVTLNSDQNITGVKHIKNDLYIDAVDSDKKIIFNNGNIRMLTLATGASAQGLYFCSSSNAILSILGYHCQDNALNYLYIGTGYEESKHWVTFTSSKTTIRGKAEVKGSLMISPETSGLNGIIATNGNGLLMYNNDNTYLSQNAGVTYIRSGNENLYHTKASNNYIILDQSNTPHVFCRREAASASHIDLTDTTANAAGFVDYTSGVYRVSRSGATAMYIKFQGSGSTSGLELYTNYVDGASLQFRKIVDNNRISGAWSYLLDDRNWNRYVMFENLKDKPSISVDATLNSLVKRSSTGFINCNLYGVSFYDATTTNATQNGWVISTSTNYGGTSKDLKIKQHIGTGGNLLLNDYRVATVKDKYVMSRYTIDASGLDEDTYYPVTIKLSIGHNYRIEVLVQLDSRTQPSWSTHGSGFAVRFIEEVQGDGWGAIAVRRRIIDYEDSFCMANVHPIKRVTQMKNSSTEVIYVRGGGRYYFFVSGSSFDVPAPILRTSTYTISEQSVSPTPDDDLEFNVFRNVIMSDDVTITPDGGKIARRDDNGYLRAIRYYTTTPVEDYAITHIAFFYNSDGYIRKTTLGGLNRQLRFDKLLNIITGENEFNMLPNTYSNSNLWINFRSYSYVNSYENTASLVNDMYIGNGQQGTAYLNAKGYKKTGSTNRYALTGAGDHMLITYDGTANALVQRDASGNVTANSYFFQGSSAKVGPNCIELYSSTTPYIDFHYGNSSDDYTTRIIEDGKSHLQIYANVGVRVSGNITAPGFERVGSSDSFVLLGGGGHKLLSEIVGGDVGGDYLPISGGTLTGTLTIASTISSQFREGIRITRASNNYAGITFGSTGTSGAPINGWFAALNPDNDFIITRDSADTTTGLKLTTEAVFWKNNLMLHIGNYNNYAPTKTGSGASGTWGISVTGNAATATTATKVSNPITFTGAVTGTWDGSSAKTVNIPSAYSLPTASATTLGGVKVGTGLSITNGVLSATSTAYTLPAATSSVLGGIKVGYTTTGKNYKVQLDSSNNAYVNVPWTDTNTTYNNATTAAAGLMSATDKAKLDGVASGANKYSLPTASTSTLGGIKIGTGLNINSNGVVSIDNSSTVQSISQTYTLTYDSSKSNVSRVVLALPDTFEWGKRAKLDISFYAKTSSTATSGYNIYYHDVINWESNLDSYAGGIVTAIGTDYSNARFAVITLTPYNSSGYSALIYIQTTGGLFTSVSEVVATLKPI